MADSTFIYITHSDYYDIDKMESSVVKSCCNYGIVHLSIRSLHAKLDDLQTMLYQLQNQNK